MMFLALLGYTLIALPFIVIIAMFCEIDGWVRTLQALGITALVVVIILAGVYCLSLAGVI